MAHKLNNKCRYNPDEIRTGCVANGICTVPPEGEKKKYFVSTFGPAFGRTSFVYKETEGVKRLPEAFYERLHYGNEKHYDTININVHVTY
jgi:hypothetical protein